MTNLAAKRVPCLRQATNSQHRFFNRNPPGPPPDTRRLICILDRANTGPEGMEPKSITQIFGPSSLLSPVDSTAPS